MPIDRTRFEGLKDLERGDQYARVFELVDEAERDGIFVRLVGDADRDEAAYQTDYEFDLSRDEDPTVAELGSRNRTLRTRLRLLGYRNWIVGIAVRKFQEDCKAPDGFVGNDLLAVDSIVGPYTWDALDELLSFERERTFDRWFVADGPRDALVRAVEARLQALGILDKTNPILGDRRKREKALADFVRIAAHIGLTPQPLSPSVTPGTVAALFGQDRIVERLAASTHLPGDADFVAFAAAAGRIELWLLGYPTASDAPDSFRGAHWSFLFDVGRTEAEARSETDAPLVPGFFQLLRNFGEKSDEVADAEAAVQLSTQIETDRQPWLIATEMEHVGSTMWDGLRRAWRWFKRLVAGAIRTIVAGVKNLARLAYNLARDGFAIVKRALAVARTAINNVLSDTFPGSDPANIVVSRDQNFDLRIFVAPAAGAQQLDAFTGEVSENARVFGIALAAFAALVDYVKAAVRFAALGWLSLIMGLLRLRGNAEAFARFLELGRDPAAA